MKPGKVLCYRILFAVLGVERAQNLTKYNKWLLVSMPIKTLQLYNSCIVYDAKQKMCTVMDLPT